MSSAQPAIGVKPVRVSVKAPAPPEPPLPPFPAEPAAAPPALLPAAPPALINAITDALGVRDIPMPATPERVWRIAQKSKSKMAAE